jgi:serine/threonine protein kinase
MDIVFPDNFASLKEKAIREHVMLFNYTYEDILHLKDLKFKDDDEMFDAVKEKLDGDIGPLPDATIDIIFQQAVIKKDFNNAIQVVRTVLKQFIDALPDLNPKDIDLTGKVVLANKLGNSVGSALVFHGYVKRNGKPELVVVKGFQVLHNIGEIEFGIKCNHPNVIKPLGIACMNIRFAKMICQILPFFPYTSLKNYFIKNPQADKYMIFAQIAKGLQYLHRNNISHNDLKYDNIFVTKDGTPVISDFGNARFLYNFYKNIGTPTTVSPAVNACALIKEDADMFALGRIYEQILSDFKFEYLLPSTQVIDGKLYIYKPILETESAIDIELNTRTDMASNTYKDNFTFLYDVNNNVNVEKYLFTKEKIVFVSKYEEECNKNLPFTNLKYLLKKDPSFDIENFYKSMENDEIFFGLLRLNSKDIWSAEQLLEKMGFNDYNDIGEDLPNNMFTFKYPERIHISPDYLPTIKKTYEKIDCNIFFNKFEKISDFDKIMNTDVLDIQEEFDLYKNKYNYDILPKYFDPILFKQKINKRNVLAPKFQWLYDYSQSHRQYFYPSPPASSCSFYSFFSFFR